MDNFIIEFSHFYHSKFKNRYLVWEHDLSWAEIQANFKKVSKNYILIVSSYQMTIIDIFNKKRNYYIFELMKIFGIPDKENDKFQTLLAHINPLIRCGMFFLNDIYKTNNIDVNNILYLNESFTSREYKIILNNIIKKQKQDNNIQNKEISHFLIEDRKHQIDTAIMKLLKQNKKLNFENLKSRVIESVSSYFIPEISTIKNRIDHLLDMDLIIRDSNDPNIFIYSI